MRLFRYATDRRRAAAAAHTHDLLARAYASLVAERAAYHRGRADFFAEVAEVTLAERELAGCVVTCGGCGGAGCATCGGAGLVYSPSKLAAVAGRLS